MIASLLMMTLPSGQTAPAKAEVEALARGYGMVYQNEILTFPESPKTTEVNSNQEFEKEKALTPIMVQIPHGSSSERIGQILADYGIITDWRIFNGRVIERGVSGKLDAGDYELSPALTIDEIIDTLIVGEGRR